MCLKLRWSQRRRRRYDSGSGSVAGDVFVVYVLFMRGGVHHYGAGDRGGGQDGAGAAGYKVWGDSLGVCRGLLAFKESMSKDTDNNHLSIADTAGVVLEKVSLPKDGHSPSEYDDVLKFSNARNCFVLGCHVRGGRENAIDMNRNCTNIVVEDTVLVGGDQCAVVIKGGCHNITLNRVLISPSGGPYDIELGGWSDQSRHKTGRVVLRDVLRTDGKPVRVVVGNAEKPTIEGGDVQILPFWSIGLKLYVFAKGLFVR